MKRNIFKRIAGLISFTSVMFVFQACYGTPQDFGLDVLIEGQVKAKNTSEPIEGIRVSVDGTIQNQLTDNNGMFSFYTEKADKIKLLFEDVDSLQNGYFSQFDTIVSAETNRMFLNIEMENK